MNCQVSSCWCYKHSRHSMVTSAQQYIPAEIASWKSLWFFICFTLRENATKPCHVMMPICSIFYVTRRHIVLWLYFISLQWRNELLCTQVKISSMHTKPLCSWQLLELTFWAGSTYCLMKSLTCWRTARPLAVWKNNLSFVGPVRGLAWNTFQMLKF